MSTRRGFLRGLFAIAAAPVAAAEVLARSSESARRISFEGVEFDSEYPDIGAWSSSHVYRVGPGGYDTVQEALDQAWAE